MPSCHPLLFQGPVPSWWGVQLMQHQTDTATFSRLDELGVGVIRVNIDWKTAEPTPGNFDFTNLWKVVSFTSPRNITVLVQFEYLCHHLPNIHPWRSAPGMAAARVAASALAGMFKGEKVLIEVGNEPNHGAFWPPDGAAPSEYLFYAKDVVTAIRGVHQMSALVGPAASGIPISWLKSLFKKDFLALVDGMSVHPYTKTAPEGRLDDIDSMRDLVMSYSPSSRKVPCIAGEWGYSDWGGGQGYDLPKQAELIGRMYLCCRAKRVLGPIYYQWSDDRPPETTRTLVDVYRSPTTPFHALKALIDGLRGLMYSGVVKWDDNVRILSFMNSEFSRYAVWSKKPVRVTLPNGRKVDSSTTAQVY